MPGPLSHLKVLDLSRILAGPWAGQVFADFGAEVIKIERPGRGDDTRHWGPPYLKDDQGADTSEAAYYLSANRGKKSVTVDITTAEGQQIVRDLAARCDILLENYKVGGLKKYGLDYDAVRDINPGIIYCSITGFGQTGPYAQRAGYDAMIQGMGGLMSVTGVPEGQPGAGPQKVGVAVADLMTGMYAVSAVLAAVIHRQETGRGQYIDLALLDTQVAWLANQAQNFLTSGRSPERQGTGHPNIVPYQAVPSRDGYFMLAVGNDDQFRRFCQIAGLDQVADQPAYATNAARVLAREQLVPIIEEATRQRDSDWWLEKLSDAHVPCGPINNLEQVFSDPQVQAREMVVEQPHPTAGSVRTVRNPVVFSESPLDYEQAPPVLGQHTEEVLREILDRGPEEIEALRRQDIV
ncbi:CaiB/BaiF CoA transferase family protein [Microbulbifer yueqingensis]|uniref:Crotonobetainyl-CoA:carnitine CoA-transferase CaiB n=1 Tax=Microbulbifer yueqingensis TaxID=658219 RepID=A0A1G8ZGQ5_9GAMM|nr:CaiB/BaiF CoA-transferase family protein [Microbulbifer yueqingensis]SDK14302.1 Crotonobetainyl-CoA:carnitine CoA-transferase CaiB [Microbulbifer yueqingensis]